MFRAFPNRRWLTAVAVLAIGLSTAACASAAPTTDAGANRAASSDRAGAPQGVRPDANSGQCGQATRTIKHDLGETTISGNPTKVVALEGSFVDALVWAGVPPIGVADDDNDKFLLPELREAVGDYTSVGLRTTPNLQVITSLKPDLIIADTLRHRTIYEQLSSIAPTVGFTSNAGSYQQILDSEMLIAQAVNHCDEMEAKLAEHAAAMAELKTQVPANETRNALFAISYDKGFTGQAAGSFAPDVLAGIGLQPTLRPENGDALVSMTLETLVASKPDIMFVAYAENSLGEQWATNPLWQELPAVRNNLHFRVDRFVWSRSRGLVAAEQIAREAIELLYGNRRTQ